MFSSSSLQNGTTWKVILILGIYTFFVLVCWEYCPASRIVHEILESKSREPLSHSQKTLKKNVSIYAATTFYQDPITSEMAFQKCPELKEYCSVTNDIKNAANADALVFHSRNFYETALTLPRLKKLRNPNVPWIIYSIESPSHERFPEEKDLFNWTMTYRRDADIWAPYGYLEKVNESVKIDLHEIWALKNKTATWLGSNCQTPNNRFSLIQRMIQKGLDVDIWGGCGTHPGTCDGVLHQGEPCVRELIQPYKFYLAIENSNCKDYVTEKLWKSLDDRMTVPIVLRRNTVQDLGVPDSAYIAVDDFENLDEFVKHVKKVSSDRKLYLKYHEWRKSYKLVFDNGLGGWCSLCERLQDLDEVERNRKSYGNAEEWHSLNMCDDGYTMKFTS